MRFSVLLALLLLVSCRPYACWYPPGLPREDALLLRGQGGFPTAEVSVVVDDIGVPHIFADTDADLAFGLGFMHARDRQFQLVTLRALATGRLSEIVGDLALAMDQRSRFFLYGLEAELEALSEQDRTLLEAYRAGVNTGAPHAGPTFEMTLLGISWEPFTPLDVMAMARLQSQYLSSGVDEELARAQILNRIAADAPALAELLACNDDRGVPLVPTRDEGFVPAAPTWRWQNDRAVAPRVRVPERLQRLLNPSRARGAGSNAWALPAARTREGQAVLTHDPHLAHQMPDIFYLVHLESDDVVAAGASIPGLPFVGIGHGRDVAWGVPLAYVDTMDLVRIEVDPADPNSYVVDGVPLPFETFEQTFKTSADDPAPQRETWRATIFGPVLPEGAFPGQLDEGDVYSLLWSPFFDPAASGQQLSTFWQLARASDFGEASAAIAQLRVPPLSFIMAFTDGSVGYFPSGSNPRRISGESAGAPRDGSLSTAGWDGFVPAEARLRISDPPSGYIVAANQPVVANGHPATATLGCDGAPSYRALRIHALLDELLAAGPPTADALLALQQDVDSVQARELAHIYADACPSQFGEVDERFVLELCAALAGFDGVYDVENEGGVPFRAMVLFVAQAIVGTHIGDMEVGDTVKFVAQDAIERAIREYGEGQQPALLDDPATPEYDGLPYFMGRAMPTIYQVFQDFGFGTSRADWRYGWYHVRYLDSVLAEAIPVIGPMLFGAGAYEETGCAQCVRAETGFPVLNGAVLRMSARMSTPPDVRFVLAGGQSDRLGHTHFDDQYVAWQAGTPFRVALPLSELGDHVEGRVRLLPP